MEKCFKHIGLIFKEKLGRDNYNSKSVVITLKENTVFAKDVDAYKEPLNSHDLI